MTGILSTNIISPLGFTTEENLAALRSGNTALRVVDDSYGVPGRNCYAALSSDQNSKLSIPGLNRFTSLVVRSAQDALSRCPQFDVKSPRNIFILSTTTADIEELGWTEDADKDFCGPAFAAKKAAEYLGFTSFPLVVCNACISGVTAMLLADRLISLGLYDGALVCGADCVSSFLLAGFGSFKSLSCEPCRPFDIDRLGFNIGEAAASVVMQNSGCDTSSDCWMLLCGALDNDAYHVSAPSPDGNGVYRAIKQTMQGIDVSALATVSAHGTATMFNDQMESKAIQAAGLSEVPLTALKGYFGHTIGAAGLVETVMTMAFLDDGELLPVKGYSEIGVSGKVDVCNSIQKTDKKSFIKLVSGFGGCNGAALFTKDPSVICNDFGRRILNEQKPQIVSSLEITPDSVILDGERISTNNHGIAILTELYKGYLADNPKFYKMDPFSRLAYISSGLLMRDLYPVEDSSLLLFNQTSSIIQQRAHLSTFKSSDDYFPSPAIYIYTLPNVVTGEIAIKYNIKGETTLMILPEYNQEAMQEVVDATLSSLSEGAYLLTGWVDCSSEDDFYAKTMLIKK